MTLAKINYKGIARAGSNQQVQDGYLEEAINVRHRDGKLTTRGKVTKKFDLPSNTYDQIWLHDQDGIENYIGYIKSTGQLQRINMETGAEPLIAILTPGEKVNVAFIKRFMIIISASNIRTYMWEIDNSQYIKIEQPTTAPDIVLSPVNSEVIDSEVDATRDPQALLGKLYEVLNEQSQLDGKQNGAITYRMAFRMFDGSYVLHTVPAICTISNALTINRTASGDMWKVGLANILATINPASLTGVNNTIYTHLVLFISRCVIKADISEKRIKDIQESTATGPDVVISLGRSELVNEEYNDLIDPPAWYNVLELKVSEIQAHATTYTKDVDTKNFYQDYATREVMTVDNFTHSKLSGSVAYTYNDRLLIGDTKTVFPQYKQSLLQQVATTPSGRIDFDGVIYNDRIISFIYTLDTIKGAIKVVSKQVNQSVARNSDGTYIFKFLPVIGYPDARASNLKIVYHRPLAGGGIQLIEVANLSLVKSKSDNFAYYKMVDEDDDGYIMSYAPFYVQFHESTFNARETTIETSINQFIDSNRVQASELQNPLFFPAKYSYQVGTGKILALAANTEPLSTGQFGEYPLAVFTSKGIWTMLQGSGDVLFSNILPLNGEVPVNADQITPLSVGVVYSTERGLFLISGREVKNLSEVLIGPQNALLQADLNYQYFLNHANIVQLLTRLSQTDAKTYISSAKVSYDKLNNELLVTNFLHPYSYVYSFDSGFWYKTSDSFRLLINAYPKLLGVNASGIHSISEEDNSDSVQVLLTTRPCKLGAETLFKLVRRVVQRCEIDTVDLSFAGFYMFASNDLRKWQLMTGNDRKGGNVTDIVLTRGHTKAKYYIFVLAANLEAGSAIGEIDVNFDPVLTNRLR